MDLSHHVFGQHQRPSSRSRVGNYETGTAQTEPRDRRRSTLLDELLRGGERNHLSLSPVVNALLAEVRAGVEHKHGALPERVVERVLTGRLSDHWNSRSRPPGRPNHRHCRSPWRPPTSYGGALRASETLHLSPARHVSRKRAPQAGLQARCGNPRFDLSPLGKARGATR
jgi:hypothetical protein